MQPILTQGYIFNLTNFDTSYWVTCNISDFTVCILQQLPQELIYTTVDFKLHQKTSSMYANLDIYNLRPDSSNALEMQDRVEYATIAGVLWSMKKSRYVTYYSDSLQHKVRSKSLRTQVKILLFCIRFQFNTTVFITIYIIDKLSEK